ncbi:MAG TPA: hypothetical protein VMT57_07400 [Candidatus Thermoplasmatota archaeon]|nr:hypothetical protein [Candidatus Thermoplasmatota archaeon]
MALRIKEMVSNPQQRARLLFWIWILSMIMTVVGYIIIFYILFWTQ